MAIGSFSASLSGLNANQQKLSVIGNNLANLNTVAFKASHVNFSDLVSQTVGGTSHNPMQVGLGVAVGEISPNFSQGSVATTGISTNVAIQGGGFFVIGAGADRAYTRAGNFGFNEEGVLVTADGRPVQGYTSTDPVTGLINTATAPTDIVVPPGVLRAPVVTSVVGSVLNLDASALTGATFATPVQVYDSLGVAHVVTFNFAKTGAGQWTYTATAPGAEVTGGTAGTPFPLATGALTFNSLGRLTSPTADVTIAVPGWTGGGAAGNITWDLIDANNVASITGYSAPSATASVTQNGSPSGAPSSVVLIDPNGRLLASFGEGQTVTVGQLALATFNNANGLIKVGNNMFSESELSGSAVVGAPGTGVRGTLIGGSLEQSNVDIAHEFTEMILAQRGYQASSKGITVADELLMETLNLKR